MNKVLFLFSTLLLFASCNNNNEPKEETTNGGITVENVQFPDTLLQGQTKLVLNGAGLRKINFFKIFVAGLYVPVKSHDSKKIIDADEPSTIRLHAVSTMLTSERLSNAIQERLDATSKGKTSEFQSRIDVLRNILEKQKIQIGDECDIQYTPNEGIRLIKNGKDLNVLIAGLDFKQALWGNWLGENPADEHLKKGLLGL